MDAAHPVLAFDGFHHPVRRVVRYRPAGNAHPVHVFECALVSEDHIGCFAFALVVDFAACPGPVVQYFEGSGYFAYAQAALPCCSLTNTSGCRTILASERRSGYTAVRQSLDFGAPRHPPGDPSGKEKPFFVPI